MKDGHCAAARSKLYVLKHAGRKAIDPIFKNFQAVQEEVSAQTELSRDQVARVEAILNIAGLLQVFDKMPDDVRFECRRVIVDPAAAVGCDEPDDDEEDDF